MLKDTVPAEPLLPPGEKMGRCDYLSELYNSQTKLDTHLELDNIEEA